MYTCNKTAYFKEREARLLLRYLRYRADGTIRDASCPALLILDDYSLHKCQWFSELADSFFIRIVLVDGGMSTLGNPGDVSSINKLIKSGTRIGYTQFRLGAAGCTLTKTGKRPYPPRSMSASWAMQSLVAIPRRTIVRAFIACGILEQALACPLTPCPPAPLHSPCAATLAHTYTVACPLCFVCRRTSQSLRMPPSA